MPERLSWRSARRIALRAQGIGGRRADDLPARAASRRGLERTLERTHLLQIDSVSVFARAHHMPVFTRRGCWDVDVLDRASRPGRGRLVQEALAHEAAFTTAEVHSLLGFRRERAARRDWGAVRRAAGSDAGAMRRVLDVIAEHGPISAAAVARLVGDDEKPAEGWGWRRSDTQWLVEYLFRAGHVDCVGRSAQFERLYAADAGAPLPDHASSSDPESREDVTGAEGAGSDPDPSAAQGELTRRAAKALGIASPADIADYFRLRAAEVAPHIRDMVATGTLREVTVRRGSQDLQLLLHHEAPRPAPVTAAALVSPFDPVAFHRPRLRDLFDVEYRIGIYTPRAQRTHGYYALPFLVNDRIVARVDLRSDRRRGVLEVCEAHLEPLPTMSARESVPGADEVAPALAEELGRAARWQGLTSIEVLGVGDLAPALAEMLS
ncbi:winged helix DNA-binding domain-containing protein [Brachybacterium halotolerans subsp. kimchii]|uniref:winged helix-turn-helix domain-containing protein n=1 Tax=Brachybacterium halotolerans TaxID=2795215 RepID=UPI001E630F58|nr:crosslink repair DNA glycosylase YcaQ family protein [Brachybacterium halotolerans]UEJ82605.1 winged helix DNA-binding domain-containing protein [Brachybacterium halotolerans subsp. kimchii]